MIVKEFTRGTEAYIFTQSPAGGAVADNRPLKVFCTTEHIPNSPPVYTKHCKTAVLVWSSPTVSLCVGLCAGRGQRWWLPAFTKCIGSSEWTLQQWVSRLNSHHSERTGWYMSASVACSSTVKGDRKREIANWKKTEQRLQCKKWKITSDKRLLPSYACHNTINTSGITGLTFCAEQKLLSFKHFQSDRKSKDWNDLLSFSCNYWLFLD